MEIRKRRAFLNLVSSAFDFAKKAHACSFDNPDEGRKEDKCSALSYAAACTAKISAAEAIYWTSPEMEHNEIEELFGQFEKFVHEIQNDFETDHSLQWVDIEFNNLDEMYQNSVCYQQLGD